MLKKNQSIAHCVSVKKRKKLPLFKKTFLFEAPLIPAAGNSNFTTCFCSQDKASGLPENPQQSTAPSPKAK